MVWDSIKEYLRGLVEFRDEIDTNDAVARIKKNIWFRGPNVWILAFAIVLASVGLNVNSTAVIIGAMLVSPLMGPIVGIGLSLGIYDVQLLKDALKNLAVMIVISLAASALFFLLSPLDLVNPTELEARTSPSIYDVMIALFGGLAGILETSRKERGTVLSGVAIATALMPPLCTAGCGLANGNWHYFFGALYLFFINGVFIILATYAMVKYLRFTPVETYERNRKRTTVMTLLLILFIIPSIISAGSMVRENNFRRSVDTFISANRSFAGSYIYDHKIEGQQVTVYTAGDALSEGEKVLLRASAEAFGINQDNLIIKESSFGARNAALLQDELKKIREQDIQDIQLRDEMISRMEEEIELLKAALQASRDSTATKE